MVKYLTKAGIIAALYAAVTLLVYPIAFGTIQFRLSEAFAILPLFFPEAIPGLFVGCILANLLSPNILILDIIFGSLATLGAAFVTSKLHSKWLAPLPPTIFNVVIVGAVITFSSTPVGSSAFWTMLAYNMFTVGFGELVVCYGLGIPLCFAVERILKLKAE